ncbi:MAG: M20/M25/M40 family metallo-hydrolase [Patescibacteria group bacterium]
MFNTLKTICQIPAPTFHEREKIEYLISILSSLGLKKVSIDSEGNALGFLAADPEDSRFVLLSAHADTACEAPLPIEVKDDGKFLHAHGICDNTAGVTALLMFLKFVRKEKIALRKNYLIAFTVGEEGLGAKRGMKAVLKEHGKKISYVVNIESHDIGRITNACVGQYRARLTVSAKQKGAHSWRNFGEPNAVVILSSIISDLSKMRIPKETTYNVTAVQGGKGINSIPNDASCLLEFRAKEQGNIDAFVKRFQAILRRYKSGKVKCVPEVLAVNAAAGLPKELPIYGITSRVQKSLGIEPFFKLGNTDGDVSLAMGIPTVTLGAGNGFATHSLEEKLEKKTYLKGIEQVIGIILALDREMER